MFSLTRRSFLFLAALLLPARAALSQGVSLDAFVDLSERLLSRTTLDREIAQIYLNAINADPEFRLAARFWNGSFRFSMEPEAAYVFRVRDGELVHVNREPTPFDAWDFEIAGPAEGWRQILKKVPPPFYQDVASAVFRHGFRLGGDLESFFAYHAALRRVVEVLRRAG